MTFAGYLGILTGQKPHSFTVTLNERDKGFLWENIFQLLFAKTTPVGFFLRSLLANETSEFDNVIQQIATVEMIAPSYIIVGGIQKGEGAVITRDRIKALDIWRLNVSEKRYVYIENYNSVSQQMILLIKLINISFCATALKSGKHFLCFITSLT